MNFEEVKAGMVLKYIGDSLAFGGTYTVVDAESTYINPEDCPDYEKGKQMIIEFMNNGTPMYFPLGRLDPQEWQLVDTDTLQEKKEG